jgi:hypothetical protein
MLTKLAYAIVGIVVVSLSFSATLFTLNLWSSYPPSDPISTGSIPAAPAARAAATTPPASTAETPINALPKIEAAGLQLRDADEGPCTGLSVGRANEPSRNIQGQRTWAWPLKRFCT